MKNLFKGRCGLFIKIALGILFVALLTRLYFRTTDDFRLSNIVYEMPNHPEWEIPPLSDEQKSHVDAILSQKFYYIGKGAQAYAFGSDDGKYVIKFFKFKHLKPSWLVNSLPSIPPFNDYKKKLSSRKQRKLIGVFNGHKLAYDLDKENSGLIYIQLNPSHQHQMIRLYDKLGLERNFDLADIVYVIQEKGVTLKTLFSEILNKGDLYDIKHRIGQIFDLYLSEYKKGIFDHDHGVMHNTGFVGNKPIHMDVGKFHADKEFKNPENYQPDLILIAEKMNDWFKIYYPQYSDQMTSAIEEKLSSIFGYPVQLR